MLVVVPAPVHRVLAHVGERVVHPAHVPLEAEAEAAGVGRLRHAGPGGRFLGDHDRAGMLAVDRLVQRCAGRRPPRGSRCRRRGSAATRPPCASSRGRASRRRHRRAARRRGSARASNSALAARKLATSRAAEIVDRGVPVGVEAPPRVGVLVERGAVEAGEAVRVAREMRRAPSRGSRRARPRWQRSTKRAKPAGSPKRRGRREQPDRLVAPGARRADAR